MTAKNYSNTSSVATLNAVANAADLTWTVASATGYPAAPFWARIAPNTPAMEVVLVTAVVGTSWTVTRGQGGTSAAGHSIGDSIEHIAPAVHFADTELHLDATTQVHGLASGSAVVGTNDSQTLANKRVSPGSLRAAFSEAVSPAWTAAVEVAADSAAAKDAVVVRNTAATSTRAAYLLEQSGGERFKVDMVGKVTVTPVSGVGIENNGTLQQDGTSTFNAAVTVNGALAATSATTTGTLGVGTNATVGGTLGVTGAATTGSLSTGNATLSGTLNVSGATTLAGATVSSLTASSAVTGSTLVASSGGVTAYGTAVPLPVSVASLASIASPVDKQVAFNTTHGAWYQYASATAAWYPLGGIGGRVVTTAGSMTPPGAIDSTEANIAKLGMTGIRVVSGRWYTFNVNLYANFTAADNAFVVRVRKDTALTGAVVAQWQWVPPIAADDTESFAQPWLCTASDTAESFHVSVQRVLGSGTCTLYGDRHTAFWVREETADATYWSEVA